MTTLPEHVRRIVAEIETEIGESTELPVAEIEGGGSARSDEPGSGSAANGHVEAAVRLILEEIGEDPGRQGLTGTPERVHRMYTELTAGYHVDPERMLNGAIFDVDYSEMV
ncbi:MAG TPA: GTP cyclohydrolase I, partial [Candidatus Acidoferrum sp.]|nr:GTP cyclohydrolase I [Candidatus Acidoferrum sp.]